MPQRETRGWFPLWNRGEATRLMFGLSDIALNQSYSLKRLHRLCDFKGQRPSPPKKHGKAPLIIEEETLMHAVCGILLSRGG